VATPASAGRIARVNRFNPDAVFTRNVRDLQEERRERPPVHDQSLFPGAFDSLTNAFQIFNHYRSRAGFQGLAYNLVRHIPEQPINRSLLFARQPLQEPSLVSALVPCGLKITALFEPALSNVFDNSALENLAGVDRGDTLDARVDTDHALTLRIGNVSRGNQVQVPRPAFVGDGSCWFDLPRSIQVLPVVVGEDQADSHSPVKGREGGKFLIDPGSQRPSVVTHRGGFFPVVALLFVSLIRLRDYAARGANEIRRQLRQFSQVSIGDVMQSDRVKDFLFKGDFRNLIERNNVGLLSSRKGVACCRSRLKFYLQGESRLHVGALYHLNH